MRKLDLVLLVAFSGAFVVMMCAVSDRDRIAREGRWEQDRAILLLMVKQQDGKTLRDLQADLAAIQGPRGWKGVRAVLVSLEQEGQITTTAERPDGSPARWYDGVMSYELHYHAAR
jgi:hypothetical protein